MANTALQNLRDIHLPAPISVWPLAPGIYFLLLLLILIACSLWCVYRYKKRYRTAALRRMTYLRQQAGQRSAVWMLSELSCLLRRVAFITHTRAKVAGLQGMAWLQFLDETGQTHEFTSGAGQALMNGPYQRHVEVAVDELLMLVEQWIKRNV